MNKDPNAFVPGIDFCTDNGRALSYRDASWILSDMLAEDLGIGPERVVVTVHDVSASDDSPYAMTLFRVKIDGETEFSKDVDAKIEAFLRRLGVSLVDTVNA